MRRHSFEAVLEPSDPVRVAKDYAIRERFPTLKRLFAKVPPHVGFNIEFKYPDDSMKPRKVPYPERNFFVDRALEVRAYSTRYYCTSWSLL